MDAVAIPYKLKVRVNGSEFEAEGPEESVKAQFEAFLGIAKIAQKPEENKRNARETPIKNPEDGIGKEWGQLYAVDNDGRVSLRVLPSTRTPTSDAILLLIYGHQTLNNAETVSSREIMVTAQQSGLRIDRIDRNLAAEHRRFVIKGGNRKGSRYSLNNRGRAYAQELLERMFD